MPMFKNTITVLMLLLPLAGLAQEEAVTAGGKIVLLFPDSTWKLKVIVSDSTVSDSVEVAPRVEKPKEYVETSSGFKGFLKPELKMSQLPEISQGVYEFRVKVNKEGYVKEVITLQRGVNGQAETLMRQAITKMKFLPDGSIVPPLTEGIIRLTVPVAK
jgi:hypothetical protein